MVGLERSSLLHFEREPTATTGTVPYGTGLDWTRGFGWLVGPFVLYRLIDTVSATAISCVPVTVILLVTLNVLIFVADPRTRRPLSLRVEWVSWSSVTGRPT
jgi:hypothetical protein